MLSSYKTKVHGGINEFICTWKGVAVNAAYKHPTMGGVLRDQSVTYQAPPTGRLSTASGRFNASIVVLSLWDSMSLYSVSLSVDGAVSTTPGPVRESQVRHGVHPSTQVYGRARTGEFF